MKCSHICHAPKAISIIKLYNLKLHSKRRSILSFPSLLPTSLHEQQWNTSAETAARGGARHVRRQHGEI